MHAQAINMLTKAKFCLIFAALWRIAGCKASADCEQKKMNKKKTKVSRQNDKQLTLISGNVWVQKFKVKNTKWD